MPEIENDLSAEDDVFRFLFASPTHFVGQCSGPAFDLTFAFPSRSRSISLNRHNLEASHFVLSFRISRSRKKTRIETYEWVGEELSALFCAFYGKLIVNLGHLQRGFNFCIPTETKPPCGDPTRPPFNKEQRRPDGPELNLLHAKQLIERYIATNGSERIGWIIKSAEFYQAALEHFHEKPEIALTLFCSALEALLPLRGYSQEELYDQELLETMKKIEVLPDGKKIVSGLKSRLYQIKRKVAALVRQFTPKSFFRQRESGIEWAIIKDPEDLILRIKKIYDIRSMLLHTGKRKGINYLLNHNYNAEIGLGSPVLNDATLEKQLVGAMTLAGLERATSTVLREVIAEWLIPPFSAPSHFYRDMSYNALGRPPCAIQLAGTPRTLSSFQ